MTIKTTHRFNPFDHIPADGENRKKALLNVDNILNHKKENEITSPCSGKGEAVLIPDLLVWTNPVLTLDIKSETAFKG